MVNIIANEQLKRLGCKLSGSQWIAPMLAKSESDAIKVRFFTELAAVEIKLNDGKTLTGDDFVSSHVRTVGEYIVTTARESDSGATCGWYRSYSWRVLIWGSTKNFMCTHTDKLILRLKVGRSVLDLLDEEVEEGRYTYKLLEQKQTYAELINKREQLLKQLEVVDQLLQIYVN